MIKAKVVSGLVVLCWSNYVPCLMMHDIYYINLFSPVVNVLSMCQKITVPCFKFLIKTVISPVLSSWNKDSPLFTPRQNEADALPRGYAALSGSGLFWYIDLSRALLSCALAGICLQKRCTVFIEIFLRYKDNALDFDFGSSVSQ